MAKNGELFVLDMGKPIKILDLAESMIKLSGYEPYKDIDIIETGLRPGEKLYEELLVKTEKLTKTKNSLIFIEKDNPVSPEELEKKLTLLKNAVEKGDDEGAREALREAVTTFKTPEEVNAEGMLWFALLAILCKGLAVWRTWKGASVNQRMVSLHLLGDCLGWVAVLLASIVMMFVEIPLLDPILSVCISLYILYNVVRNLIVAFRIVLEGVPVTIDYLTLKAEMKALEGVDEIEALRVWSMDNVHHAATVALTTTLTTLEEVEVMKSSLRQLLIQHSIELSVIEVSAKVVSTSCSKTQQPL
jgi:hypothetical protein